VSQASQGLERTRDNLVRSLTFELGNKPNPTGIVAYLVVIIFHRYLFMYLLPETKVQSRISMRRMEFSGRPQKAKSRVNRGFFSG
jgi:hypothetical protein